MDEQGKTPLRRVIFRWTLAAAPWVCLTLIGSVVWLFVVKDAGDFTKVPLDQSPFLRDLAEPITLIRGRVDWGSDSERTGMSFVDGKHVERYAEYIYLGYGAAEISHTLLLGEKLVPVRGREERAFLGVLQRWYRQDAEAQELTGSSDHPDFSTLTEQQQAKVIGVSIMRMLLKRN